MTQVDWLVYVKKLTDRDSYYREDHESDGKTSLNRTWRRGNYISYLAAIVGMGEV